MECVECRRLHRQLVSYVSRCESIQCEVEFNRKLENSPKVDALTINLTTLRMYAEMTQIEIDRHQGLVHDHGTAALPPAVMVAGR